MKILVTGGTGYIGSHTVLSLQEAGCQFPKSSARISKVVCTARVTMSTFLTPA